MCIKIKPVRVSFGIKYQVVVMDSRKKITVYSADTEWGALKIAEKIMRDNELTTAA